MTSLNNLSDRRASVEIGTMARSTYLANHRSAVRPESTNLREHGVFTPKILEAAGSINWLPPPGRRLPHSDDLRESIVYKIYEIQFRIEFIETILNCSFSFNKNLKSRKTGKTGNGEHKNSIHKAVLK